MLIVLGILAVLLGLLYGAFERARKTARYAITYSELKQLQVAFEQYYAYYHVWPTNGVPNLTQSVTGDDWGFVITEEIAYALQGVVRNNNAVFEGINPDGVPFIEFPRFDRDGYPVNPFKTDKPNDESRYFRVLFDTSGNRQISVPAEVLALGSEPTNVVANVVVWTVIPSFRESRGGAGSTPELAQDRRLGSWDTLDLGQK
ncbi:MAG: hypothetical protein FWH21_03215 [Kiritimatiellaeota bacterium]|nr:hypothetical protein [Kiritimatiellota bacterium]